MLMTQFQLAGGRTEQREFHDPQELADLPEEVVINCTGYGARALWRDQSIVQMRGYNDDSWVTDARESDAAVQQAFARRSNAMPCMNSYVIGADVISNCVIHLWNRP